MAEEIPEGFEDCDLYGSAVEIRSLPPEYGLINKNLITKNSFEYEDAEVPHSQTEDTRNEPQSAKILRVVSSIPSGEGEKSKGEIINI